MKSGIPIPGWGQGDHGGAANFGIPASSVPSSSFATLTPSATPTTSGGAKSAGACGLRDPRLRWCWRLG